jgi:transposase
VQRWLNVDYPRLQEQASEEGAEIHWLDEAGLRSDCSIGRGYSPVGRPPLRRVPGQRFGVTYVATVSSAGLLRFLVYVGKLTGATLTIFLGRLLANRPGRVYVVLDKHPTHRGREVARWVGEQEGRIRLAYLPSYSPELNPAEFLNNDVKANASGRCPACLDRQAAGTEGDEQRHGRMPGAFAWPRPGGCGGRPRLGGLPVPYLPSPSPLSP